MDIRIKVTDETWNKYGSIEAWLNFSQLTNKEMYELMLNFVVDEKDEPIEENKARKLFLKVPPNEWLDYIETFAKAITSAFVNPTNGSS